MDEAFDRRRRVVVGESGLGHYGQVAVARRHVLTADEPEGLGGKDTGPDPIELLMTSLATCTAMTMRMYINRKHLDVGKITVIVEHEMPSRAARRESDLFVKTVHFEPAPEPDIVNRLLAIADRCPVHQILCGTPTIETLVEG